MSKLEITNRKVVDCSNTPIKIVFLGAPKTGKSSIIKEICVRTGAVRSDLYFEINHHGCLVEAPFGVTHECVVPVSYEDPLNPGSAQTSQNTDSAPKPTSDSLFGRLRRLVGPSPSSPNAIKAGDALKSRWILWDILSHQIDKEDEYERLRPLSYPGTDVFAFCFDMRHAVTIEIARKIQREAKHHVPSAQFIFIGTHASEVNEDQQMTKEKVLRILDSDEILDVIVVDTNAKQGMDELLIKLALLGAGLGRREISRELKVPGIIRATACKKK